MKTTILKKAVSLFAVAALLVGSAGIERTTLSAGVLGGLTLTADAATSYPTPAGYKDHDYKALVTFANQENNLARLGWDLSNPASWTGITWVNWAKTPSTAGNGYADINTVTRIELPNRGLTGELKLNGFDLDVVMVSGNQLKKIDVTGNTYLYQLNAADNQLTSLVMSGNSYLNELNVSVNKLTTLDVSKNTSLTTLYASNNLLTSLNTSKVSTLLYLEASNNQLSKLDLGDNTRLRTLLADHNKLSDITTLKDLNSLGMSGNARGVVDVSYNTLDLSRAAIAEQANSVAQTVSANGGVFIATPQNPAGSGTGSGSGSGSTKPVYPPVNVGMGRLYSLFIEANAPGYKSYAVVSKADMASNSGKAISWKDIKPADIMVNGYFDFTAAATAAKTESGIVFSTATASEAKKAAPKIVNVADIPNAQWFSLPAVSPKITKPVVTYAENPASAVTVATVTLADDGLEWGLAGSKIWTPVQNRRIDVAVKPWKFNIQVRRAMTDTTGVSPVEKVAIAQMAVAPTAKVDLVKGTVTAKTGWLIYTDATYGGAAGAVLLTEKSPVLTLGGATENLEEGLLRYGTKTLYFRVPLATDGAKAGKAPGSVWGKLDVDYSPSVEGIDAGMFSLTTKGIDILGGAPIQKKTVDAKGVAKWSNVTSLKAAEIFGKDVILRIAGTKSTLPGAEVNLSVSEVGTIRLSAVYGY